MAVLKAAPRTADSLALFAEAQLEMGQSAEAVRTAEQALALDADAEAPRLFLCRLRVQEQSFDKAARRSWRRWSMPPIARREFARPPSTSSRSSRRMPGHQAALEKMAQVLEAEGNRTAFAKMHTTLGEAAELRGDPATATGALPARAGGRPLDRGGRDAPQADRPSDGGAAAAAEGPGAGAGIPGARDRPGGPGLDARAAAEGSLDRGRGAGGAGRGAAGGRASSRRRPRRGSRAPDEQQLETLIVEAEVFANYGLSDKAIERLVSVVRRRPDLLKARERLVELLAESKNPGLPREAESLAAVYRRPGGRTRPAGVLASAGLADAEPDPRPPRRSPASGAGLDVEFEEFDVAPPGRAAGGDRPGSRRPRTRSSSRPVRPARLRPSSSSTPEPLTPADTEFVSYEQLGNLLEDEMRRPARAGRRRRRDAPAVDEENLFADEQKFFNLAEELEKELGDEAVAEEAAAIAAPQGEVSLEEIFREFKKGVEQQLSAEDYETHYNLGIAYKEMGLVDEAIGEFQLASKDPGRAVECCSMLGHCFLEKGMPQLAIKWFRKGLETPAIGEVETAGMLYDLARVYQDTGDMDSAYKTFQEVYGLNANYRDVVQRVKELEAVRKNSWSSGVGDDSPDRLRTPR